MQISIKSDVRLFLIFAITTVSIFGAAPVAIKLNMLSLSAVFTLAQLFAVVLIVMLYSYNKNVIIMMLPLIGYVIYDALGFIYSPIELSNIQDFVVWLGFLLIIMLSSSAVSLIIRDESAFKFVVGLYTKAGFLFLLYLIYLGFNNSNDPATPMIGIVFFSLILACMESKLCVRWGWWIVVGFIVASLLMEARIILLTQAVLLGVYAYRRHGRRGLTIYFLFGIGIVASIVLLIPEKIGVNSGDAAVKIGEYKLNTAGRMNAWLLMIDSIAEAPIIGHGVDIAEKLRGVPRWNQPHNDYLRLWNHNGIIGLLLFLYFLLSAMVKLYLASCSMFDVRKRVIMLTAVYVLLGLMIVMITDNVIVYSYVMFIFAVFIGAGAGVVGMSTSERMLYNCMMVNKGVMCK